MRRKLAFLVLALFLLGGLLSCWPHGHNLLQEQEDCQVCRVHTTPALSAAPQISCAPAPVSQDEAPQPVAFLCSQQMPAAFLSRAPPVSL